MAERISVKLSKAFTDFFRTEKGGAVVLIACTLISLAVANSNYGESYVAFWHSYAGPLSIEHWVNDGLMAVFFLLIGLELKRELYIGELSDLKNASLPIIAALGGVVVPALIHFAFNAGAPSQAGIGIPMATDIAFAIGVLSLVGDRVPASLKVFLVALAVMDDLAAIVVIAVFYTTDLSLMYLALAFGMVGCLAVLNYLRVMSLVPYLLGGAVVWYLMLRSGVHATIAGVLVAFTIPFVARGDNEVESSPSKFIEHVLHKPVSFFILPVFALANTGIVLASGWADELMSDNSLGVLLGLTLGKPIGITAACFIAVMAGISRLPLDLSWRHIFGAGLLGGIGFTMSIFITNLAFPGVAEMINASKMAILLASLIAGVAGFLFLKVFGQPLESDEDPDTMDYQHSDA